MLTRSFLKSLTSKAHKINPVILIGGNGLTTAVHQEIDIALNAHELIKVRVNAENREERDRMITEMVKQQQAILIQKIGHIVVLYREKSEN